MRKLLVAAAKVQMLRGNIKEAQLEELNCHEGRNLYPEHGSTTWKGDEAESAMKTRTFGKVIALIVPFTSAACSRSGLLGSMEETAAVADTPAAASDDAEQTRDRAGVGSDGSAALHQNDAVETQSGSAGSEPGNEPVQASTGAVVDNDAGTGAALAGDARADADARGTLAEGADEDADASTEAGLDVATAGAGTTADTDTDTDTGTAADADAGADTGTAADADAGADTAADTAADTGADTGADTAADAGTDTAADSVDAASSDTTNTGDAGADADASGGAQVGSCDCNEQQVCELLTGTCHCVEGYAGDGCASCDENSGFVEWPEDSGNCILDPCIGVTCGGAGTCSTGNYGMARCDCLEDRGGLQCDQQWRTITVPPFALDVAFDAEGNGWFATSLGLLYWDFGETPGNTADDSWQLFAEGTALTAGVAIDSAGRKWVASVRTLQVLDDQGSDPDTSGDLWQYHSTPLSNYESIERFRLDGHGRLWIIPTDTHGVAVLPDIALLDQADPPWLWLFEDELVFDIGDDGDGLWLAAESGLYFIDVGSSLEEPGDDQWMDLSGTFALSGQIVKSLSIDSQGVKWLNTDQGIVRMIHRGDPFDESGYSWMPWSPERDHNAVSIGPIIGIDADDAKWVRAPWGSALRIGDGTADGDVWTEYAPRDCPLFADRGPYYGISTIALSEDHQMWVGFRGALYHFDDGGTPLDSSDDVWVLAGSPEPGTDLNQLYANPNNSVWVNGSGLVHGPLSCNPSVYYFDGGDLSNGFDDAWLDYTEARSLPGCTTLFGTDAGGLEWFKFRSANGGYGPHSLLDDGGTPLDPSDDAWIDYTDEDEDFLYFSWVIGFEPGGGVWIGGVLFDYGDLLEDKSDDQWMQIDPLGPGTVAVDGQGNRWFGYSLMSEGDPESTAALRYLDAGRTLFDISDDTWVGFGRSDGLAFDYVHDIKIDGLGRKWIVGKRVGEAEPGLCSLDDNGTPEDKSDDEWVTYSTNDGLVAPGVKAIAIDTNSDIWIATSWGINYLHVE